MQGSIRVSLFLVRVTFGVFLLVWGLNKLVNPEHTARIFENFYYLPGIGAPASAVLGLAQMAVSLAIVAGYLKTLSYGLGVLIHGVSTLATLPHLLFPLADGSNILFMAGLPVLAGAVGLFLARDADTLLSADGYRIRRVAARAL